MELLDLILPKFPIERTDHYIDRDFHDVIFVRDVQIQARIGPDAWGRDKLQPVTVSARLPFSVAEAGESDKIVHTLDYRKIYNAIRTFNDPESGQSAQHQSLAKLADQIMNLLHFTPNQDVRVDLIAPKALLHSDGIAFRCQLAHARDEMSSTRYGHEGIAVKGLHVPCIIGIGEHERLQKQPVVVDIAATLSVVDRPEGWSHQKFGDLFKRFEASTFLTLEAFVTTMARYLIEKIGFETVAVSAHKPSVFGMAEGPGVQIVRTKADFNSEQP